MKRQRIIATLLFFVTFLIFVRTPVLAKVYINEFSSATNEDWVEFYNDSDTEIDLSIYKIVDAKGNTKNLEGSISSRGLSTLDFSNRIDKAGDTLKIIYKSNESLVEDQVSFGIEGPANPAPSELQSLGRKPNGAGLWALLSQPSKGSSNDAAQVAPSPTSLPTPTPTNPPTPTKAPTPTRTPTPTKTPTPIKSVTTTKPTATTASLITQPNSGSSNVLAANTSKISPSKIKKSMPTAVLGEKDENVNDSKKVLVKEATEDNDGPPLFLYIMFLGGALCMAICGILFYRNKKRGI